MSDSTTVAPTWALHSELELWAGPECTRNRVGDQYFDQLDSTGHGHRPDDLRLIAELGAKAVRYPTVWERLKPTRNIPPHWQWCDERLALIRALGMRPIAGLVHHGSGPAYTSLVDPEFGPKLAEFAAEIAQRYPWLAEYTPINEPLTTARFSGLYGHWYPHCRDDRSFLRCLLNQIRGTVLAMRAIRQVNPNARLVQTEDLGLVASSPLLRYQADFENERRWLSLDLLCGKVDNAHPLWYYLLGAGIAPEELEWFAENPCPPDILGFNYYLTSQRFLHEKLSLYPPHLHGGNGRHRYADVELVRVSAEGLVALEDLLGEAWARYRVPIAITECHNGCTREEQLRWIDEVWTSCEKARAAGVDVRAVTAWSVFGATDWNTLLTRQNGHYEPGVFDIRAPRPRATALAKGWRILGSGEELHHPALDVPGWWRRPERLVHGFAIERFGRVSPTPKSPIGVNQRFGDARALLITGATGTLGRQIALACEARALPYKLLSRSEMDIADAGSVASALARHQPWAVINAAGYVRVDEAENDGRCMRENALGPEVLAKACARRKMRFVTFSSDLVFDGQKNSPYVESDPVAPLNEYGRSKVAAEQSVLRNLPESLIIRTSAFFSPTDEYNFITSALRTLSDGGQFVAADDYTVSPTFVPDLVQHTLDLLLDEETGIWHLANQGEITWYELARSAAERARISTKKLVGQSITKMNWPAMRPRYSALASERGWIMPSLESALQRYVAECRWLISELAA